jgi:hypothetical protein
MKIMNEKTNQETEKPAAKRRMRWWIPITIVALAIANVARIRASAELYSNFKNMQAMLTINDQEAVCYQLPKRTSQASERASLEGN